MMRVGIIDYGMGNLYNVQNACRKLGIDSQIANEPSLLADASHLILPGVGGFPEAIDRLEASGFIPFIRQQVSRSVHLMGICLGMQLLFEQSTEFKMTSGIGLLPGEVIQFQLDSRYKVPHVGWNELNQVKQHRLFRGIDQRAYVYYVHSYHLRTDESTIVIGETDYGYRVPVMVAKDTLYGCQFHPEKSGDVGLKLLENFFTI